MENNLKAITNEIEFSKLIGTFALKKDYKIEKINNKCWILEYLSSFEEDAVAAGLVFDSIKGIWTDTTIVTYSDGEFFWDTTDMYYFEKYDIKLSVDFLKMIEQEKERYVLGEKTLEEINTLIEKDKLNLEK